MNAELNRDPTADAVRAEVLAVAKAFHEKGLVVGTAGNVSGRMPGGATVCMTPSSMSYDTMTLDDLVVVDLDGNKLEGGGSPTSEKSLHLECYKRYPEVGGVIHSHAPYASMFALVREPIPAAIEEVVTYIGGDVPICDYRMTGTDELGAEVASHLADRSAALMANHGLVCIGKSPSDALHASLVVERTAQIVWGARALGTVVPIPEKSTADFANVYQFVRSSLWPS
ncbi:class II aldolase/adducin family protein [Rhabdothermincola sediminis]|uniref:class II aldolase/adducin family protein n=1 Tax=Rhabdothermincola sediminis TaxID=2751370 RepID=UPI001AA02D48|nr:class II aldolase/adducin family protein [Rhabdothermincola sediminis]